jgi:hypothetical protein
VRSFARTWTADGSCNLEHGETAAKSVGADARALELDVLLAQPPTIEKVDVLTAKLLG